jgi:sugar lactone lactonase YvrE
LLAGWLLTAGEGKRVRAEQLTDPVAYHGEGPVWSTRWGGLRWVDMLAGDVLSLHDTGEVSRRHVGSVVAVLRPRNVGGAVMGVERGFALEDPDGTMTYLQELWSDQRVRMNEGACDPDGRFYCGSMAYDQAPGAASLYRLDTDGSVTVVLDEVTVSNGLDWSPDGSRAYYNDTATGRVAMFEYEPDSGLTNRRTFVAISGGGQPDGLTVDGAGGVWVAIANASQVQCYGPDGVLNEVVEVDARKVTACTFGGNLLDQLFITTSREGLGPGQDPLAGALFTVTPGVSGMPTREFAG